MKGFDIQGGLHHLKEKKIIIIDEIIKDLNIPSYLYLSLTNGSFWVELNGDGNLMFSSRFIVQ